MKRIVEMPACVVAVASGLAGTIFIVLMVSAALILGLFHGSAFADHLSPDAVARMSAGQALIAHGIDVYSDLPALAQVLLPTSIALAASVGGVAAFAFWWRKGDKADLSAIVALCEESSRCVHTLQERVTEFRTEIAEIRGYLNGMKGD